MQDTSTPRAQQPHHPKNLLSRTEVCAELGISKRTLRRYELAGMVSSVRLSKRSIRYRRQDIEQMLNRFTAGAR
mgnify:CR=1 FL=1